MLRTIVVLICHFFGRVNLMAKRAPDGRLESRRLMRSRLAWIKLPLDAALAGDRIGWRGLGACP